MKLRLRLKNKLKELVGNLFGSKPRSKDLSDESDEAVLEKMNELLTLSYHNLAGGQEECKKIFAWMNSNPDIEEVTAHNRSGGHGFSFLVWETLFAKIIRRYDREMGTEQRKLGDPEIECILDHGRTIRLINRKGEGDLGVHYAYTVGNSTSSPPAPELIAFYPGKETCKYILNKLSDLFSGDIFKPIIENEVREVTGILGDQGQIPIRIWSLTGEEREAAQEQWTTTIPRDEYYPLYFVDIPDTTGYYGWESECHQEIKSAYPASMARAVATSFVCPPHPPETLPVSADAGSLCVQFHKKCMNASAVSDGQTLSEGTWLALTNMEMWIDPATWLEDEDVHINDSLNLLRECSYQKGARAWVLERLDSDDAHDVAFEWWLPRPEGDPSDPQLDEIGFEEHFSGREELLEDIDFDVVSTVIRSALTDCTNLARVESFRNLFSDKSST